MGGLFGGGGGGSKGPSAEMLAAEARRKEMLDRDTARFAAKDELDRNRIGAGLYGQQALLSGNYRGFPDVLGSG